MLTNYYFKHIIGVSILACTQDEGAPGVLNEGCADPNHPVTSIFPASSPWVTAISGTTFMPVSNNFQERKHGATEQNNGNDSLPICQHGFPCMSGPVYELPCSVNNT